MAQAFNLSIQNTEAELNIVSLGQSELHGEPISGGKIGVEITIILFALKKKMLG